MNHRIITILIGLTAGAAQGQVACNATLDGGSHVMDADILDCGSTPALTLTNGAALDMNGHVLTCADTGVNGIVLIGSGASVRNGKVSGCTNGISLLGDGGHTISRLAVVDNGSDGVHAVGSKNKLISIYARGNLAKQIYLSGDSNKATRCHASEGTAGIHINGSKNKIVDSAATESQNGFVVESGTGNSFKGCIASSNSDGFHVEGTSTKITASVATSNGDDGFSLSGAKHVLSKSSAILNAYGLSIGYDTDCTGCTVSANRAWDNTNWNVYIRGDENTAVKNDTGGSGTGFELWSGTPDTESVTLAGNVALSASLLGIDLRGQNGTIKGNVVAGSGNYDLSDADPICATNTWRANIFATRLQSCEQ